MKRVVYFKPLHAERTQREWFAHDRVIMFVCICVYSYIVMEMDRDVY